MPTAVSQDSPMQGPQSAWQEEHVSAAPQTPSPHDLAGAPALLTQTVVLTRKPTDPWVGTSAFKLARREHVPVLASYAENWQPAVALHSRAHCMCDADASGGCSTSPPKSNQLKHMKPAGAAVVSVQRKYTGAQPLVNRAGQ